VRDYRPDFEGEAAYSYKPEISRGVSIDARGALHRYGQGVQLTPMEGSWLRRTDGKATIRELTAGSKPGKGAVMRFFADMWERGHLVFELG
jgi:hypothetical protein